MSFFNNDDVFKDEIKEKRNSVMVCPKCKIDMITFDEIRFRCLKCGSIFPDLFTIHKDWLDDDKHKNYPKMLEVLLRAVLKENGFDVKSGNTDNIYDIDLKVYRKGSNELVFTAEAEDEGEIATPISSLKAKYPTLKREENNILADDMW